MGQAGSVARPASPIASVVVRRSGLAALETAGDAAPGLGPVRARLGVLAAFFAIYVVWGSTYLAIAVAVEAIPPLLTMGVRSVLAGLVLYGGARLAGAPPPARAEWLAAARVGLLFFVIGHGLLAWSETRVPSGVAAVLIATEPLFIVLLGWRGGRLVGRPRGDRPGGAVALAIVLGLLGVGVLTVPGSGAAIDPAGAAGLLVASFAWSLGTFHVPRAGSPFRGAGMQLMAGGGVLLLLATLLGETRSFDPFTVGVEPLLALGYLVTFGSVLAFGAYTWLLRRVSAARVASHTYVNPLIAVALGSWLGGEQLGPRVLLAAGMVLTAVLLLVQRARQRT